MVKRPVPSWRLSQTRRSPGSSFHGEGGKRFDEAAAVFNRMLWMTPSDNQGARFNLTEVRAGTPWEDRAELKDDGQ